MLTTAAFVEILACFLMVGMLVVFLAVLIVGPSDERKN